MDLKLLITVYTTIFIAEIGDKTQLATLLFASEQNISKLTVFTGSALALITAAGIGVLAGATLSSVINPKILNYLAGVGFIAIGIWTLIKT